MQRRFHAAILALVALALLSLPFTHHAGAAPVTPQIAQYLAMGGDLADICGEGHMGTTGGCESCQMVGTTVLGPAKSALVPLSLPAIVEHVIVTRRDAPQVPHGFLPPARAPPETHV